MRKCAVIIDNRDTVDLRETIKLHKVFLPDWDLKHYSNYHINNGNDYNKILTDYQFWANLDYDKVLIFQHDSMLLKEIPENMLNYSYVGAPWFKSAPWAREDRSGGNGGLSIRDVNAHKLYLSKNRYDSRFGNEDVFFTHNLPNVAPYEVCSKFSVETEFKLGTVGYHAIDKHLTPNECKQIKTQYL
ncbi:MAG: hypothetical protein JXQ96_14800 [Cyclobacteriaceae bacterium]